VVLNLITENPAGRYIVAVAKATRDANDLEFTKSPWRFQQPVHVPGFRRAAGKLERVRSFLIAIRSRRSQN
jgi:hypothetical protein